MQSRSATDLHLQVGAEHGGVVGRARGVEAVDIRQVLAARPHEHHQRDVVDVVGVAHLDVHRPADLAAVEHLG